jgi:hypothetical protein
MDPEHTVGKQLHSMAAKVLLNALAGNHLQNVLNCQSSGRRRAADGPTPGRRRAVVGPGAMLLSNLGPPLGHLSMHSFYASES